MYEYASHITSARHAGTKYFVQSTHSPGLKSGTSNTYVDRFFLDISKPRKSGPKVEYCMYLTREKSCSIR